MKKIILLSLLLLGCSPEKHMSLECIIYNYKYGDDYDKYFFTFERDLGKKATLIIDEADDPLFSRPIRSFTELPIAWTPSNIVINLKEEETTKKYLGYLFTTVHYKDFIISRSSLTMEVKAWAKISGPPEAKIEGSEPIKLLGECKEIKYKKSNNSF